MRRPSPQVDAAIPHLNCHDHLRAALESLHSQSLRPRNVFVISDGDRRPPWDVCAQFPPGWVRRLQLERSMGPYFGIDLVLRASNAEYILIQDADDVSDSHRLEMLLGELIDRPDYITATSAQILHGELGPRFISMSARFLEPVGEAPILNRFLHHGLHRRKALLQIGGYYGGFPYAFDAFLTGLIHHLGAARYIDVPLYHRYEREGSLTMASSTGIGSERRSRVRAQLLEMLRKVADVGPVSLANRTMMEAITRRHVLPGREREIREIAETLATTACDQVCHAATSSDHDTDLDKLLSELPR